MYSEVFNICVNKNVNNSIKAKKKQIEVNYYNVLISS